MARQIKLSDLIPDSNNANKGTERGRYMLDQSLTKLGAGRSILVDKNNVAIAGNKTLESAVENGFTDAVVIDTTGDKLVVVRRTDLDMTKDSKAKELAIADNRVGQVSLEWDEEIIVEIGDEVDLSDWFKDGEIEGLELPSIDDRLLQPEDEDGELEPKQIPCPNCGHLIDL